MGRARTLEVMLSAQDYDADLAERYGRINRSLPAQELGGFVRALARLAPRLPLFDEALTANYVRLQA
jgi:enoyl-CoA hydratase/carnithine racemase